MNKPAAIYTRVSSDRQKQDHTIASQTAALMEYARPTDTWCRRNGSSKTKGIVVRVYSGLVWKRFVIWRHKGKWPRC